MSFKEVIQINEIKFYVNEIYDATQSIDEFGHCVIATEAENDLRERSKDLIFDLKQCLDALEKFNNEMEDWYGH